MGPRVWGDMKRNELGDSYRFRENGETKKQEQEHWLRLLGRYSKVKV